MLHPPSLASSIILCRPSHSPLRFPLSLFGCVHANAHDLERKTLAKEALQGRARLSARLPDPIRKLLARIQVVTCFRRDTEMQRTASTQTVLAVSLLLEPLVGVPQEGRCGCKRFEELFETSIGTIVDTLEFFRILERLERS